MKSVHLQIAEFVHIITSKYMFCNFIKFTDLSSEYCDIIHYTFH